MEASVEARESLTKHLPYMSNIAKSFAYTYRVDEEDIRHTLIVWWLGKYPRIEKYVNDEDVERGKAHILTTLTNVALAYCRRETAARAKTDPADVFLYSMKHIQKILPFVETPEHWTGFATPVGDGEGRAKGDPATGGDAMATYADLRIAWQSLTESDREVLRARFHPSADVPYGVLAEEFGVDEKVIAKRVERALSRVQRRLGGARRRVRREGGAVDFMDGSARRPVGNAAGQAIVANQWGG